MKCLVCGIPEEKGSSLSSPLIRIYPPPPSPSSSSSSSSLSVTILPVLEVIVKRRVASLNQHQPSSICPGCQEQVMTYSQLTDQLDRIATDLRTQFQRTNPPAKKGRKPKSKEDVAVVAKENVDVVKDPDPGGEGGESGPRKSGRSRKRRIQTDYIEFDHDQIHLKEDKKQQQKKIKLEPDEIVEPPPAPPTGSSSSKSIVPVSFACDLCGKSFGLKSNLCAHSKTAHTTERPFSCDKCEKTFKQRFSLREHVLRNHDNIKKFGCGFCDERFLSRHLMKVHERTHTNETRLRCDVVSKTQKLARPGLYSPSPPYFTCFLYFF